MKQKKDKTKNKHASNNNQRTTDPYAAREAQNYEEPIASREYILQYIAECKRPPGFQQLVDKLKIANQIQKKALDKRLTAMIRDGQLSLVNHKYQLIQDLDLVEGEVIGHPEGFGFLKMAKNKQDLYIPNYEMQKVFPGDKVKVLPVVSPFRTSRTEAKIVSVVTRAVKQLVGKVALKNDVLILVPENQAIKNTIFIDKERLFAEQLKENSIVVAEITRYPSKNDSASARIIEIIGDYHAPGIEIETALRRFNIPHVFPNEVLAQVENFSTEPTADDLKGRLDLRSLPLVTIDGEDAKDFDDAVYCEELSTGGFKLLVAIADVSNYVSPNSPLDHEAYLRGTSVYFPGQVVPMLPEVLSNGLCSLNPHVDRLCFVCEAELDQDGKILRYRFLPAVMRSQARLTYTIVADILINNNAAAMAKHEKLVPHLKSLYKLFKVLNLAREYRGAIDFDSTETMIEFDDNRKIAAIHPVIRNDAHRLIEECMLVANVCAAHFCLKYELPVLYRNHEPPPEVKLDNLQEFLKPLGLALKRLPPTPKDISNLLKKIHSRPDNHIIQMVVLRSLSQAMYEPDNKGHFGLAYEQYAHFTSPIRRYPDLLLHRELHYHLSQSEKWQQVAANTYKNLDLKAKNYFKESRSNLQQTGEQCSTTERRADEATRDVTSWLKCEYMQDKVGLTFNGVISTVTGFGLFVELDEVYVEGLIHVTDLHDDYYRFDERQHMMRGEHTGKKYRIGDPITVVIARVNLENRHIDFILPEGEGRAIKATRPSKSHQSRKKEQSKTAEKSSTGIPTSSAKKNRNKKRRNKKNKKNKPK